MSKIIDNCPASTRKREVEATGPDYGLKNTDHEAAFQNFYSPQGFLEQNMLWKRKLPEELHIVGALFGERQTDVFSKQEMRSTLEIFIACKEAFEAQHRDPVNIFRDSDSQRLIL